MNERSDLGSGSGSGAFADARARACPQLTAYLGHVCFDCGDDRMNMLEVALDRIGRAFNLCSIQHRLAQTVYIPNELLGNQSLTL